MDFVIISDEKKSLVCQGIDAHIDVSPLYPGVLADGLCDDIFER